MATTIKSAKRVHTQWQRGKSRQAKVQARWVIASSAGEFIQTLIAGAGTAAAERTSYRHDSQNALSFDTQLGSESGFNPRGVELGPNGNRFPNLVEN